MSLQGQSVSLPVLQRETTIHAACHVLTPATFGFGARTRWPNPEKCLHLQVSRASKCQEKSDKTGKRPCDEERSYLRKTALSSSSTGQHALAALRGSRFRQDPMIQRHFEDAARSAATGFEDSSTAIVSSTRPSPKEYSRWVVSLGI